ncbi:MAG: mannitol dehydrogenase family protein [Roseibium sp.]|uniref:mannitol dehydrogenase family protein n=1 Tax=Roseibium sp. TaxID=1936156 RepID=UPI00261757EF|nr:mannitol dehydrogenase family protein [Roseibium sp.]MCV0424793.1 mannitol dehydrogenase family protein [Roseibium sp.]
MTDKSNQIQHITYDRADLRPRLLHIGFGAFAKAHTLVFHDEMLRHVEGNWGVVVARLNSGADELTELDHADCIYSVGEMSDTDLLLREVGAVVKTLHPMRDGVSALLSQISSPELAVITLTITEKGYCLSGDHLDLEHPGIDRDLRSSSRPTTSIGVIVEGLRLRQEAGLGGVTVLSCDNLPSNGHLCRRAILEFSRKIDPALHSWIETNCRFPCSMVDRITPAMTEASFDRLENALGRPDPNGILCEPFRQWVIEDSFASERPAWDLAGAEFVTDVAPFEEMKLRLLNGTHSFLAYLGALAGKETIADCMADPVFLTAARKLMLDEQVPTLEVPEGVEVSRYADSLINRFSNTALHHKTTQIASDGSQKLPQRLLDSIRRHLETGHPWPLSALAVAGWMLYCRGVSEAGDPLPVNDPLAGQYADFAADSDGPDYVRKMLSLSPVFGRDFPGSPAFADAVQGAFERLRKDGVLKTLSATL